MSPKHCMFILHRSFFLQKKNVFNKIQKIDEKEKMSFNSTFKFILKIKSKTNWAPFMSIYIYIYCALQR